MTPPASVAGDERLRLFLALQLPESVVAAVAAWQRRQLRGRLVPPPNLHVTLAFLGPRPSAELDAICAVLADAARSAAPPSFQVVRYRETRSAAMLELGDRTSHARALANRLHVDLAALGVYRPERRAWLPHVTVVRYRERPRLSPPLPELDPFAPSGAAALLSRLHPTGARYEVLTQFPLGG